MSTRQKRNRPHPWGGGPLILAGSIALSVALPTLAAHSSAVLHRHRDPATFKGNWGLSAATFKGNSVEGNGLGRLGSTKPAEVRLLWLPRKGWLPEGGFNLYRSEPGNTQKTKLNAQPIQPLKLGLDPAKLPTLKGTQAGNTPAVVSARESFSAITVKPSGGTFQQMATEAQTLQATPGLSPATIRTRLSQGAAVQSHIQSLKLNTLRATQSRAGTAGGSASAPASTPADDTALLRGQIILHALGNWEIATDAALAFADTTAQANHRYTYTLKAIDANGQEQAEPLAALDFTVGSDALPPTPAPMALQSDQGIADLHWDPPTSADMDRLLFAGYHVWRVDAAHPSGVKLNEDPIVLTYQQATDGSLLQALTSYRDKSAPLGNVTYRVSLIDAYGRESQPGTFALTLNDLRIPVSVPGVRSILKDEKTAYIYWLNSPVDPNDTASRAYTLYRRDGEIKPVAAPQRISELLKYPEGSSGTLIEQMPLGVMIDLFGLEKLRDLLPDPQATKDEKALEAWRSIWGTKTVADLRSAGKLNPKLSDLLKGVNAATDGTATSNHFWVYGVSAAYTTNKRETVPAEATPLPFPDLTVPATPGSFSAMFTKQAASFGGYDFASKALQYESKSLPRIAPRAPVITEAYNAQGQKTTFSAASKPMGHAAEQGGTVHLSWQPVSGPQVTYRVYRVIASGMFPANAGTGQIGMIQNLKAFGRNGGSIPQSYYLDYPNAAMLKPTLLAVTGQTAFDDPLPRSHGMNYLYWVQAVTRWGKESTDKGFQKVYIPATLPPSVPQVVSIYTNSNGQVELIVKPAPDEEQVTEYRVFRNSASPDQVQVAAIPQPTQVALAGHAPGAPPVGLSVTNPRTQVAAKIGGVSLSPTNTLGSAGARFGIKRYTSPAALLGRSLHPTAAVSASGSVKKAVAASGVPTLSASAIARLLDIKTTTELKNGTDVVQGTATQGLTFTDTTGQPGQDYLYRVIAVGRDQVASALSLPLDGKPITTKANPVQNLQANMVNLTDHTTNTAQAVGSLTWTAPTGGAGTYIVERAKVSAGVADADLPYQPLTTLDSTKGAPATGYHDTLVRAGRTYRYRITATDDEGFVSVPVTVDLTVPIPGTPGPSPALIATHVLKTTGTGVVTGPSGTGLTTTTVGGNTGGGVSGSGGGSGGGLTSPQPATGTAHFHQAYQLGSAGRFAVRVDAASYTTDAYAIDAQNYYYCRPAEKFLKLKLRVRNVSTQPQQFDYQTVTAACLSADGTPGAATKNWKALDTNTLANRTVAPNAELAIEGVLTTDAMGSPQSISFGGSTFDLSDPANAIPALDAASEAPAAQGTLYPLAYTTGGVTAASASGTGYKVTLTVKNATLGSLTVGPEVYTVTVSDEDGDKYTAKSTAGKTTLTPGGTTTIDYTFEVPRTIHIQKISFREKDSRVYVITQGAN